eukprot:scaffold8005_cov275-Amphora_coffeaeformis.AAC.21
MATTTVVGELRTSLVIRIVPEDGGLVQESFQELIVQGSRGVPRKDTAAGLLTRFFARSKETRGTRFKHIHQLAATVVASSMTTTTTTTLVVHAEGLLNCHCGRHGCLLGGLFGGLLGEATDANDSANTPRQQEFPGSFSNRVPWPFVGGGRRCSFVTHTVLGGGFGAAGLFPRQLYDRLTRLPSRVVRLATLVTP